MEWLIVFIAVSVLYLYRNREQESSPRLQIYNLTIFWLRVFYFLSVTVIIIGSTAIFLDDSQTSKSETIIPLFITYIIAHLLFFSTSMGNAPFK